MKPIVFITILLIFLIADAKSQINSITVPITLDHNRMLVDGEIKRSDGTWRKVRIWIDSGNPVFQMSWELASELGYDLKEAKDISFKGSSIEITEPVNLKIAGLELDFTGVKSKAALKPYWMFSVSGSDCALSSTVLKKYHIIYDYPNRELSIGKPGSITPRGISAQAYINKETGIVQLKSILNGDSSSFSLDVGAGFSFMSEGKLIKLAEKNPDWEKIKGAVGGANMWGWWPMNEEKFIVTRIKEMKWGEVILENFGIAGFPDASLGGITLGEWYSRKTAIPVEGFLGGNVLKNYRIEIDYANSMVYFEKSKTEQEADMDIVGISIRQMQDGGYLVGGIVEKNGRKASEDIEEGDIIINIEGFVVKSATMGTVIDKLRGKPGEEKKILLERNGRRFEVKVKVERFL